MTKKMRQRGRRIAFALLTAILVTMLLPYTDAFAAETTNKKSPYYSQYAGQTWEYKYNNGSEFEYTLSGLVIHYCWNITHRPSATSKPYEVGCIIWSESPFQYSSTSVKYNETSTGSAREVTNEELLKLGVKYWLPCNPVISGNSVEEVESRIPQNAHINICGTAVNGIYEQDLIYYYLTHETIDGITSTPDPNNPGTEYNPTFDTDLGYLKAKVTHLHSKDEKYENGYQKSEDYITWEKKTSSGFDLTDNKYRQTRVEIKVEGNFYYYDTIDDSGNKYPYDNNGLTFDYGTVHASKLGVGIDTNKVQAGLYDLVWEMHAPLYAHDRIYTYYLRVLVLETDSLLVIPDASESNWKCGGWTKVTVTRKYNGDATATGEGGYFDEDGNWIPDPDSGYEDGGSDINNGQIITDDIENGRDDVDNGATGDKYEDSSIGGASFDEAVSAGKSLLDMIGNVPSIVRKVFSFLPDWCLNFVGLTFVVASVLIIYKLIRG